MSRDFPYNIVYFSPAAPLGLFSNRISNLSRKLKHILPGTAQKSGTYVQNPLFPTILADRRRCSPFQNTVFSRFAHHPTILMGKLKVFGGLLKNPLIRCDLFD
jgi:hypothetical protein